MESLVSLQKNTDPTKYSFLSYPFIEISESNSGELYKVLEKDREDYGANNRVFFDRHTFYEYVEVLQNPKEQMLISLILKGIISVADIVRYNDIYLSSVMNLNNIGVLTNQNKLNSIFYLLELLFFDGDHDINYNISFDGYKYYIYDFGYNCFAEGGYNDLKKEGDKKAYELLEILNMCDDKNEIMYDRSHLKILINGLNKRFLDEKQKGYLLFMTLIKKAGIEKDIGIKYRDIFVINLSNLYYRFKILDNAGFAL